MTAHYKSKQPFSISITYRYLVSTITCLLLSWCISNAAAANYYFSTAYGNDSRTLAQANDPATPWKSLTKLNAIFNILKLGDSILFNRGETFTGSLTIINSGRENYPIVVSAYGMGDKPVISGFSILSVWTSLGKGIYEAYVPSLNKEVNMVTIDNIPYAMGRYPNSNAANKGWIRIGTHTANNSITGTILPFDFTGGDVAIRKTRWIIDKNKIASQSGRTINYVAATDYPPENGYGYFIQNHSKTLDQFGEWYYNPSTSKMKVYFGTKTPASFTVRASATDTLVTVHNFSNIVFDNLAFTGSNVSAFDIQHAKNIHIQNCNILFSGTDGIDVREAVNLVIEKNKIENTNNNAFHSKYGLQTSIVRGNIIRNTSLFAGMGRSSDGSSTAIVLDGGSVAGAHNLIEYNSIDSTGYIGISFSGDSNTIKNNFINYFTLIKDDGGGIYTQNAGTRPQPAHGRKLIGNIIGNGIGAKEGTPDLVNEGAHGIYMDDNSSGIEVSGNTVFNCSESGIYNNSSHDIIYTRNTLYNNATQFYLLDHINIPGYDSTRNIVFKNNIVFTKNTGQLSLKLLTSYNTVTLWGTFDSNSYYHPFTEDFIIKSQYADGSNEYHYMYLSDWQSVWSKDLHSKSHALHTGPFKLKRLISSSKFPNSGFNNDISEAEVIASTSGNARSMWESRSKLDGGALKISYSRVVSLPNHTTVYFPVGPLDARKKYILRFSTISTEEGVFSFRFQQNHAPWSNLVAAKKFKVLAVRKDHEFLISFPPTDNDMVLQIQTDVQSPFWIDNLTFCEADVTGINPDDSIRFEYNASRVPKTIRLPGRYTDVKNVSYTDSITLEPYSSVILIRK